MVNSVIIEYKKLFTDSVNTNWELLNDMFPKTINEILEWINSDEEIYIDNYYLDYSKAEFNNLSNILNLNDRSLYEYFDNIKININVKKYNKFFICKIINNNKKEICYINTQYLFKDRIYADICGFLNGMKIREKQL